MDETLAPYIIISMFPISTVPPPIHPPIYASASHGQSVGKSRRPRRRKSQQLAILCNALQCPLAQYPVPSTLQCPVPRVPRVPSTQCLAMMRAVVPLHNVHIATKEKCAQCAQSKKESRNLTQFAILAKVLHCNGAHICKDCIRGD